MKLIFFFIILLFQDIYSFSNMNFSKKICNNLKNKSHIINMNLDTLKDKNNLPQFSKIEAKLIESNIDKILNDLKKNFKELENEMENEQKDYYNLSIYKTEKIEYDLEFYWGLISHLTSVTNTKELRDAHEKAMMKVIDVSNSISQSRKLYNCLDNSLQKEELNSIQKRILENKIFSMKLNGVDLDDQKKEKFLEISKKLADLSNKFRNNVLDSIKQYKLIIEDKTHMNEMPQSAKELYSEKAKKEKMESNPEDGPWVVTLDGPSLIPFMTFYPDSDKRKELYKASITKASKDDLNNQGLILEILKLHQELSELLGYKNYVEVSLTQKMANEDKIYELLNNISKKSKIKGQQDFKEVEKYAEEKYNHKDLNLWDYGYYSEKFKEQELGFKEEELKPYFKFESVLSGLFDLSQKIFNIKIIEIDTKKENIDLWHPDVKFFRVYDTSDFENEIAAFYLDPFVRPGDKKGGAWMNECVGKSKNLGHKPVAYLILNGTPPLNGKPSLMTLSEVETLFHEFGHGLQHMLTTVDEASASGISNIEWDAVELPSQFMENWCYHRDTIMGFAKHYQTGKTLPEDLYQKILKQNKFHVANGINRQIYFSMLDLYVYQNEIKNIFDAQKKISEQYLVRSIDNDDRFLCSFEHIFAGGYSAGYYSYKWAEIMSLDAFGAFEEILNNDKLDKKLKDKKIEELGLKFRNTILSKGGGTDPLTVFKEFRGREPTSDSFMKHYGLD